MGSLVSLLLNTLAAVLQVLVLEGEPEDEPGALSLAELLEVDDNQAAQHPNWELICRRLRRHPEEAAAYCQTVDPSPLQQCLSLPLATVVPLMVVRAFVEAYEDAVFHTDRHGVTPLLVAVQRAGVAPQATAAAAAAAGNDQETNNDETNDDTPPTPPTTVDTSSTDIIQLLLQTHPGAARQADRTGKLPLHHVRSDVPTAERLVQAYPKGVAQPDRQGRLPLHYYCASTSMMDIGDTNEEDNSRQPQEQEQQPLVLPDPQIARLLVQGQATTAAANNQSNQSTSLALLKDKTGLTPIDILFQTLKAHLLQQPPPQPDHDRTLWEHRREVLWQILTVLVQSTTATTISAPHPFQMVHALVSLRCPALVMKEALGRFPEQAVQRDAQGRTPLLLAVAMLNNGTTTTTTTNNTASASTTTTTNSNNVVDERPAVICELLRGNAAAAARMTDAEGRLAIDSLAEQGVYDVNLFEAMVQAEPRAVDTRDLKNKQHPFLTAALAGEKSNVASVYHLLRAQPHVIRYFLNEC